jgi:hypothetical protein
LPHPPSELLSIAPHPLSLYLTSLSPPPSTIVIADDAPPTTAVTLCHEDCGSVVKGVKAD